DRAAAGPGTHPTAAVGKGPPDGSRAWGKVVVNDSAARRAQYLQAPGDALEAACRAAGRPEVHTGADGRGDGCRGVLGIVAAEERPLDSACLPRRILHLEGRIVGNKGADAVVALPRPEGGHRRPAALAQHVPDLRVRSVHQDLADAGNRSDEIKIGRASCREVVKDLRGGRG